jgi:hypothetical protein
MKVIQHLKASIQPPGDLNQRVKLLIQPVKTLNQEPKTLIQARPEESQNSAYKSTELPSRLNLARNARS